MLVSGSGAVNNKCQVYHGQSLLFRHNKTNENPPVTRRNWQLSFARIVKMSSIQISTFNTQLKTKTFNEQLLSNQQRAVAADR